MDIYELIKSGANNLTLNISVKDLHSFANDIVKKTIAEIPKPESLPQEKYLTIDQAADLLSVSRVTLWSWNRKGILQSHRIGNLRRYRISDIEAFVTNAQNYHKKPFKS